MVLGRKFFTYFIGVGYCIFPFITVLSLPSNQIPAKTFKSFSSLTLFFNFLCILGIVLKVPQGVVLWGVQPFVQTAVLLVDKQSQFSLGTLGICLS